MPTRSPSPSPFSLCSTPSEGVGHTEPSWLGFPASPTLARGFLRGRPQFQGAAVLMNTPAEPMIEGGDAGEWGPLPLCVRVKKVLGKIPASPIALAEQ